MIEITLLAAVLAAPPGAADLTSSEGRIEPIQTTWAHPVPIQSHEGSSFAEASCNAFLTTNEDPEGDMPRELVVTPDGSTALIVNRDTDTLTFLDIDSVTITDTVTVGDFPVSVDVTPDGAYALTADVLSNTVTVVDLAARQVATTIKVSGQQPFRVEVTEDGAHAVVGVINDGVLSAFSIIDLDTFTESDTFFTTPQGAIGGFFTPESGISGNLFTQFAVSPDSTTIVLPDRGGNVVTLYDLTDGDEIATIPVAALPSAVDIADDGSVAVVSHEGSTQTISVIDLDAASLAKTVATGQDLYNEVIKLTPDAHYAMAALLNNLIFVDLVNNSVTANISTGTVGDIEVTADGQYAFVSNFNARVIDIASQTLAATIPVAPGAETAASPVDNRMVVLNNRFAEDALVFSANGAASAFDGMALSGEINEGDATRSVAISPDGATGVATNLTSRNVSILDLSDASVRAYVDTGDRVWDAAITPDGDTAVVTNTDASTVSIIDLSTDSLVATLSTPTRPTELAISPDGTTAYVTSVAGTDQIYFINIDGADSAITGNIPAGQLGSIIYTYNVSSGIGLSPDGSILAVCVSFDNILKLVDTNTHQVIANVPVGDFPIRVAFAPDGDFAYVTNAFTDSLSVVQIDGGASHVVDTVGAIEFPLTVTLDDVGAFAYVGSFDFNNPSLKVVDLETNTLVDSIPLNDPPRAVELDADRSMLYVATTGGELVRIFAAGDASQIVDTEQLSNGPSDLALHAPSQTAVVAQPIPDGVDILRYGPSGDCDGNGVRNILDFVCFQTQFSNQTPEGDCNADGLYNILDFVCFQAAFLQGCP